MKLLYKIVAGLLVISNILSFGVSAKQLRSEMEERMINSGYTSEEIYAIEFILIHSDENVPAFILKKYKQTRDWSKVAESYGVDGDELKGYVDSKKEFESALNIPDSIYDQMIQAGMTEKECIEFAKSAYNGKIEVSTAWEASKNGKTIKDIIKERRDRENAKSKVVNDYIFSKISEEEFNKRIRDVAPEMTSTEVVDLTRQERAQWEKFRIVTSGITEEEIEFGKKAGINNIFDLCTAKSFESFSNLNYEEFIVETKNKAMPFAEIMKNNINLEKLKNIKSKEKLQGEEIVQREEKEDYNEESIY